MNLISHLLHLAFCLDLACAYVYIYMYVHVYVVYVSYDAVRTYIFIGKQSITKYFSQCCGHKRQRQ